MAKPIHIVEKRVVTEEEKKQQRLGQVTDDIAKNDEALKQLLGIIRELHESGILEAAESMLKAKAKISEILLGQATRTEVTHLVNHGKAAAGAFTDMEPEQTKKLVSSVANGWKEAKENEGKKVSYFGLLKALKDPDINRALGFGIGFLKGFGKTFRL